MTRRQKSGIITSDGSGRFGKGRKMKEKKYARLTLAERKSIEKALGAGASFKSVAASLSRCKATVSREVMRNVTFRKTGGFGTAFNDCANRRTCNEQALCEKGETGDCRKLSCGCRLCFAVCQKYKKETCAKLKEAPYVCNGCERRRKCTLEKALYGAAAADKNANALLRESRSGINVDPEEIRRLSAVVSPLIRQGQSPWHIANTQKDLLMVSDKTLYSYIAANLFETSVTDLLRKVRMKPRRAKPGPKVERACRNGRDYRDFISFVEKFPDTEVVQTDTVIGKKGGGEKCLLTIHFPSSHFMLAFIRDANTARSVTEAFDGVKRALGLNRFEELFPLILTDNGSEFSNPSAIETDRDGLPKTRIFYCDPNCAYQKGSIETNHRLLRMIFPKGKSLNAFSQEDVNLALGHVNSYARKSLGGLSPFNVFVRMHGNGTVKSLGIKEIPAHEINLTPSLLK
jgi:IS30 family transposase